MNGYLESEGEDEEVSDFFSEPDEGFSELADFPDSLFEELEVELVDVPVFL